ncbi:MAG: dipeptidase [Planctomycetota bacterium]
MESVIERLRERRQEHVDRLKEWLRIPSISTDSAHKAETRRAGEFILDELRSAGFEARMTDTAGHPIVTAQWLGARHAPTLLVYGHYDVQPPDPLELWRHGPFEPTEEGRNLVARGATDDKGQVLALVRGICGFLEQRGSLPVNVKFVIEGEEEIGSPSLEPYIEEHREELAADLALVSDCSQFGPGMPAITVGLKGLVYLEVEIRGPNRDLHSGSFGGSVENPGNALAAIIGRLKDAGGRITIPGFYDDVRELTEEERHGFAELPFDEDAYRDDLGVARLFGEEGFTTLERKWARPTLDVNGLLCGYTGEGAKTVLPSRAMAKFSMRLVPDQDPGRIREATIAHLESICPPTVAMEITCHHGAEPILVDPRGPFMQRAVRAVERGFGKKPVFIREGGSIPVVSTLKSALGVDTVLLGLGLPDDNTHSPNEKFNLDDFQRGIETAAYLLEELAGGEGPR